MHKFIEAQLVAELGPLKKPEIVGFAAASATRQLQNYEWYGREVNSANMARPREILLAIWEAVQANSLQSSAWDMPLKEVMDLLPEESDDWGISHSLADDALSSLAYTIRYILNGEPQEAAWAARRAYEAADQASIKLLDAQLDVPGTEDILLSSAIVQRELARQRRDLVMLLSQTGQNAVTELHMHAYNEDLLLEAERIALSKFL